MIAIQRMSTIMLLSLLIVATCVAEMPKPSNGAEEAYIAYVAAWKNKDMVELNAVIADDYMTLNGQRKVAHKADEIAEAKTDSEYDKMQVEEIHSVVVGDTAVLSGLTSVAGKDPTGKPYAVTVRFLATLLKRNGHWQIIADQSAS